MVVGGEGAMTKIRNAFPTMVLLVSGMWLAAGLATPARAQELLRPHLTELWSLSGFQDPESVVFEPREKVLYVSNMNGAADVKDGNGFISKVSTDGRMLEKDWLTGLNAPKGLTIANRKLFAADIDELVEISFSSREVKKYSAAGAKFLNDVTSDEYGRIYVSDMLTDAIYRLAAGRLSVWVRDPMLASPNGVLAEKNRLVVGSWGVMTNGFETKVPGHLVTVSYNKGVVAPLGDGTPIGKIEGTRVDRFPGLKVILGHLGEILPFLMRRIDWAYLRPLPPAFRTLPKSPSEYLKNHVFVTTSGNYYKPAFMCTLEAFGIDKILLGTDYPYDDPRECHDFVERLPLSEGDKEKIFFQNAKQLGISV